MQMGKFIIDNIVRMYYLFHMKFAAWLILMVLTVGIIVPPSLPFLIDHQQEMAIGVLDVCHAGTPAIAAGGEMPCMNQGTLSIAPTLFHYSGIQASPVSPHFAYSLVDEHPPQA